MQSIDRSLAVDTVAGTRAKSVRREIHVLGQCGDRTCASFVQKGFDHDGVAVQELCIKLREPPSNCIG